MLETCVQPALHASKFLFITSTHFKVTASECAGGRNGGDGVWQGMGSGREEEDEERWREESQRYSHTIVIEKRIESNIESHKSHRESKIWVVGSVRRVPSRKLDIFLLLILYCSNFGKPPSYLIAYPFDCCQ